MSRLLGISEATSIALHAMVFLAANPKKPISTREIASALEVSEAHLSKVMQRLVRTGLVTSMRGPRGGFMLERDANDISLLEVYESIEGALERNTCLLGVPICGGKHCILGKLPGMINKKVADYLSKTRLLQLTNVYRGK